MSHRIGQQPVVNNQVYSAFLFAIFGGLLAEKWLIQVSAGPRMHIATIAASLALAGVALRRQRMAGWTAGATKTNLWNVKDVGWVCALLAFGTCFGHLALAGWVTPFGIAAVGVNYVPWSKIDFAYRRPVASAVVVCIGGALTLALTHRTGLAIYMPADGLILWYISCLSLLSHIATHKQSQPLVVEEAAAEVS